MHQAKLIDSLTYPETAKTHKILFGIALIAGLISLAGLFYGYQTVLLLLPYQFRIHSQYRIGLSVFRDDSLHHTIRVWSNAAKDSGNLFFKHALCGITFHSHLIRYAVFVPLDGSGTACQRDQLIADKTPYLNTTFFHNPKRDLFRNMEFPGVQTLHQCNQSGQNR